MYKYYLARVFSSYGIPLKKGRYTGINGTFVTLLETLYEASLVNFISRSFAER